MYRRCIRVEGRQRARAARFLALVALCSVISAPAAFAETIPPVPTHHVEDAASLLAPATVERLNQDLSKFERETTDQVVVAIYPHMDSTDTLKAYATRVFNKWGIGQKGKNNGVLLLIFSRDRILRISVGSGLETTLTDAACQEIIDTKIVPAFKAGNYDTGVSDGVQAILDRLRTPPAAPFASAAATSVGASADKAGGSLTSPRVVGQVWPLFLWFGIGAGVVVLGLIVVVAVGSKRKHVRGAGTSGPS